MTIKSRLCTSSNGSVKRSDDTYYRTHYDDDDDDDDDDDVEDLIWKAKVANWVGQVTTLISQGATVHHRDDDGND